MQRDVSIIKKRKKVWDHFGWGYKSPNVLYKKGSLNCGCLMCQARTFFKRKERRDDRHNSKLTIKNEE